MEKVRKLIVLLIVYVLIFWIGFKSGEAFNRMGKPKGENTSICTYYIIERHNQGNFSEVTFERVNGMHPIIKFMANKNLRELLKMRDIMIYKEDGEKIY